MGRMVMIVVMGFIVVFGFVRININRTSERVIDNSSNYARNITHNHLTASATEYAISIYLETGKSDTSISDTSWGGSSITAEISLVGQDTLLFIDTVAIITICEYDSTEDTTQVNIVSRSLLVPQITSSLGVYSDSANFTIGSNIGIYGVDTNIDGTTGSAPDLPAITVSSVNDSIQLENANLDSIKVNGGDPRFSVNDGTTTDITQIVSYFEAIADQNTTDCPSISGGTEEQSTIAYIDGDCDLSGNFSGYGILVVDGSLRMTGRVRWYGMVIVTGVHSMDFDFSGTPAIYGALIVGSPEIDLSLSGTADIYYSSEAMQIVQTSLENSKKNRRFITDITWLD